MLKLQTLATFTFEDEVQNALLKDPARTV